MQDGVVNIHVGPAIPVAGELATLDGKTAGLLSLPMLLLLFSLLWLFEVAVSLSEPNARIVGVFHDDISQALPVKDLMRNPVFSHRLHCLPVRSRARSPALIAPWLALGPSLWLAVVTPAAPFAALAAAVRPSGLLGSL